MATTVKAKIIFLGDSGVGKTSIVLMQEKSVYNRQYSPTIGATFIISTVQVANAYVQFQIWDTAGQERFRSMIPMYLRNSKAAIVVYDITNRKSFENITEWIDDIHRWQPEPIDIIILGNKADLEEIRQVTYEEGKQLADNLNCKYCETSARNDSGIEAPFLYIAEQLILKQETKLMQTESIKLTELHSTKKKKCCRK